MAKVFVTGGSGFIGRRLVNQLLSQGHSVSVLVRSQVSADVVTRLGATAVRGELTVADTWQQAVEGSEVLFHLAAETDVDAELERHELVTVQGTRAALEAARAARVPKFVHCGSEAALLAGEPLVDVDESAPLRPDSAGAYCATKAQAEQLVIEANDFDFVTVSIRPRFVWGPESFLVEGMAEAAKSGNFGWIEGGRWVTDTTYVDNAVHGLILGWLRGAPAQAYFITDRHRVTLRDFLETQFALYGVTNPVPDIDEGAAIATIPVPARWFLGQDCTLRTEKAVTELGYEPQVTLEEGIEALRASLSTRSA